MSLDTLSYYVLIDLAVIVAAAWVVGGLCLRVGQPRVVGEILAGILLGPTLLGDLSNDVFPPDARDVLAVVGQIGLAFFMFLVGLAVDWSRIEGRIRGVAACAVGAVVIPAIAGLAVVPLLWQDTFVAGFGTADEPDRLGFGLMVAAMLVVTALPVAVRIMQELDLDQTDVGIATIATAAVATVLMFLLVGTASDVAGDAGASPIVRRVVWTAVFLLAATMVVRPALRALVPRWGEAQALAAGVVLMFVGAAAANRIGINVIVGAFVAGAVMPDRERLATLFRGHLQWVTASVLLPVFLAYSGLNTDLGVLDAGSFAVLAALTVVAILSRLMGAYAGGRMGGLATGEAWTVAAVLNCRGLLVLVVGLAAVDAGVFTAELQVGSVVVALVTTAMTGPLVARVARPNRRAANAQR